MTSESGAPGARPAFDEYEDGDDLTQRFETALASDTLEDRLDGCLGHYYNTGEHADLTLICGDRKFKVHKVVLASNSQKFAELVKGEGDAPRTELVLHDAEPEVLDTLFYIMYNEGLPRSQMEEDSVEDDLALVRHLFDVYRLAVQLRAAPVFGDISNLMCDTLQRGDFPFCLRNLTRHKIPVNIPAPFATASNVTPDNHTHYWVDEQEYEQEMDQLDKRVRGIVDIMKTEHKILTDPYDMFGRSFRNWLYAQACFARLIARLPEFDQLLADYKDLFDDLKVPVVNLLALRCSDRACRFVLLTLQNPALDEVKCPRCQSALEYPGSMMSRTARRSAGESPDSA